MSAIAAFKSERSRDEPRRWNSVCLPPANHDSDDQEVNCTA
jgi:hypothetical protein